MAMKTIYVCSPLAGQIENNIRRAREFSKFVINEGGMPIAPHTIFTQLLDDLIPEERKLGMEMGIEMLKKSDEIWVFGDRISTGMAAEIKLAQEMKMPIYRVDERTFERTPFEAAPEKPTSAFDPDKIDLQKRSLTHAEFDQLVGEIKNITETYKQNPAQLAEYLAFKAQFYQFSANNTLLIQQQNRYATFVASFKQWEGMGYKINKGEHHINRLIPDPKMYQRL